MVWNKMSISQRHFNAFVAHKFHKLMDADFASLGKQRGERMSQTGVSRKTCIYADNIV
jgi:hypothetical protein